MPIRRFWALLCLLVSASACGGSSAPPASPTNTAFLAPGQLHGRVVDGLSANGLAGIRVHDGSTSVTSNALGEFTLNPILSPEQGLTYTFSGTGVVERITALKPGGSTAIVSLIPSSFDLRAFDEMFRSTQLLRWRSAPPLRIEMRTARFADIHALEVTTMDNRMADADRGALIDDLTWALPQLTGGTFTAFADVSSQTSDPNVTVPVLNASVITVVRLKGLTMGSGFWGYSRWRYLTDGTVTGGLIMLDEDFELSMHPRRRALRSHELGHALGMGHVTVRQSIMNGNISVFEPNDFDKQAARLAFQRPPGNRAPDIDPIGYSTNKVGGSGTWSAPIR